MKTLNLKPFYKGLLVIVSLVCFSFNSYAKSNNYEQLNHSEQINIKTLALNFNSLQDLNSYNFKKLDETDELDFRHCTVSASVSAYGVSVTLSVTAPTCAQAGAGAASAVKAFLRAMK